jgi:hypothetical protein
MTEPSRRWRGWLRVVAAGAPAVFTLDWLLLGFSHLGYLPRRETISALSAHDGSGWPWMVAGQAVFALGCLALAVLVRGSAARRRMGGWTWPAAAFFTLAAYGTVQASVFRTICTRADATWCRPLPHSAYPDQQWLHGIGTGIVFGSLLLACPVVAYAAWRGGVHDLAVVSTVALAVALPSVVWFLGNAESSWHGFAEKVFLLALSSWLAFTGYRLGDLPETGRGG